MAGKQPGSAEFKKARAEMNKRPKVEPTYMVLTVRITESMAREIDRIARGRQKRARSRVVREILERGLR